MGERRRGENAERFAVLSGWTDQGYGAGLASDAVNAVEDLYQRQAAKHRPSKTQQTCVYLAKHSHASHAHQPDGLQGVDRYRSLTAAVGFIRNEDVILARRHGIGQDLNLCAADRRNNAQ
jgi:hypothetical protein